MIIDRLIGTLACAVGKGIENLFLKQEKKNLEYLEKLPFKHKFIIREVKKIMSDMEFAKGFCIEKNFFVVYSSKNTPMYIAHSKKNFPLTNIL